MPILTELYLYPIKSCAGIALREATLTAAGLMTEHIYDREWMVVDANGAFMTQREHPRMALITPRIKTETLELRAPGMLRIEIPLGLPDPEDEKTIEVKVWDDVVTAYDCDETTAAWFSNFLGKPCRLVRFHANTKRFASTKWTGGVDAPTLFSDGFPMLVISEASLVDLNDKLKAQGRAALPMNRFRPSIVIGGIEAFDEDHAAAFRVGSAVLKPVKPCPRCPIPSIDPSTGEFGPDPLDILRTYRVDPRVDGGITFGMNTILLEGGDQVLRIGQNVEVSLAFD
ncbi:MAG TPA: MOSC N-terminal beta barrel domain-containing protein [Noviherbaspirillum sp.]|uniref:MOSC domain-containing protein n=1 Tax=Noviherbaspirillum sp. TaxID=1926288 RepID=UPI002B4891DF|nr:MOSC N-terminal beta barrel domain-containing protein [Noviherbaspirillum sp.]HJV87965.1 MOSC N-terminal beta barrel domain-containing protein [Noviherbaspirillum sp.]